MTVQELVKEPDSAHPIPGYPQLLASLSNWFRSRGVPSEEAKDLGQETIVRTLVHLKRHGQRGDDLKPLVFTIARNLLTERARRGFGNVVTLTDDIDVADPSPSPLDSVVRSEEQNAVAEALASLGSRHRKVIELWMRGQSPAEIGHSLGIKRNAADALLHRARRRLASVLRESGEAFGGFIGLLGLRLRRLAAHVAAFDPSTALATAATGLSALGVATAISFAPATPHAVVRPGAQDLHARPVASHTAGAVTGPTHAPAVSSAQTPDGLKPGVTTDIQHEHVGLSAGTAKDPKTGKSGSRGLDVWYVHGSSQANHVVDPVVGTACGTLTVCGGAH